jgi:hypothetical protein
MEELITEFQNPVTRYTIITSFERVKGRPTHSFLSKMIMCPERVSPRVFESYLNMFPESIFIRDSLGNFPEDYLAEYNRLDLLNLFSEIKETLSGEQMLDPANTATERATRDLYEISLDDLMEYQESSMQGQLEKQKLQIAAGLEPTPLIPISKGVQQRITQLKAQDQQRQREIIANKLKEAEQRAAIINAKLLAVQTEEANRIAEELIAEEQAAQKPKKGAKAAKPAKAQPPKQSPQEIKAIKERERLQQQEEKRRLEEIKAEEQRIISLAKAREKHEKELQRQQQALAEKKRKDQEKAERQRLKAERQRLKTEQDQLLKQLEQQSKAEIEKLLYEPPKPQPGKNPAAQAFIPRAPLPVLPEQDELFGPDDLLRPSFGTTKQLKNVSTVINYLKTL